LGWQCFEEDNENIPPITVVGPRWIEGYLREYSLATRHQVLYKFVHNAAMMSEHHELESFFKETFGIDSFRTCSGTILIIYLFYLFVILGQSGYSQRKVLEMLE
jgi:hypothetical protein